MIVVIIISSIIYVYVFSMCTDLAEKRLRYPQGLSFALYMHFRNFKFLFCWIVRLANLKYSKKDRLNATEVLISTFLTDSYSRNDEFVSVKNILREYNKMKEEIKNWNLLGIHYISRVDISRKKYERNCIETVAENDGILWLNEKYIEQGLDHRYLWGITRKYDSDHRNHRCELIEEPKEQCNRIFIDEKLPIKIVIDCRTTSAHKFRTRLEFKQYDVIITKEQSVVTKTMAKIILCDGKCIFNSAACNSNQIWNNNTC